MVTATKAIYKPGAIEARRNVSPQNATAGPEPHRSLFARRRERHARELWLRCRSTSRRSLSLLHRILRNTTGRVDKQGNGAARVVQAGDDSKPQKWRKMAKLNRRRRWRGPALGGRLQRGVRFCFSAHDGEATTPTLTEWARPEIVHAGRWPTATQMVNQARALRSIGAKKVRRAGNGWVWRLSDNEAE